MRIGLDAHALGTQAGGNETFIRHLLDGLREVAPETDLVAYVHGEPDTAGFPAYQLPMRASWLRVPVGLPRAVHATEADLLHVQYIAPPAFRKPFVVTLHDMVWRRFPETLPRTTRFRLAALVPHSLRRASRVFVVSEAMKSEAMRLYGVPEERIDVVPNAVDPAFRRITAPDMLAAVKMHYGLPERYIAYLGALQPRKNVDRLAEAVVRLRSRGFPHGLVIIGPEGWQGKALRERIAEAGLNEALRFTGYVPPDDLPALLSAADAFAYVSLYEGFGIPVAEALACGVPTVISTDPALQEVAGDAAVPCDPLDSDSIAAALEQVLTDDELRRRLEGAGPAQVAGFTPAATARAALAGYRKAL